MLGGWLHRHTCFVAAKTMRGERRRQSRERQAVEMNALQNDSGADFSHVAPMLDEAINELGDADRTAILLRFFEQRDFRSVGLVLGSNEDAARMRVTRALEKLESSLKQRGVTTSSAALSVVLAANAVQAAPVGLAVTVSTAAALAGTTIATTATATKAIAMTTLQKALIAAVITSAVGTGIYEARQASQLRDQNQMLQQQQAPTLDELKQFENEREDTLRQIAALREENERLSRNTAELAKLRGEIGVLRQQAIALKTASALPSSQTSPAISTADSVEQTKRIARDKHPDAMMYAMQFIMFAQDNKGWYPTNWQQVANYGKDHPASGTNEFEMVHQFPIQQAELGTNLHRTALLREYLAWPTPDGRWGKVYGFADGHSQVVFLKDGNFTDWERENTFTPQSDSK
jgi:hypothetical protein